MSNSNLPVKSGEDFVGELEQMDLSELKDKTFLVAVSNGDRNKSKFVSTTVRGPYSFAEMCEEVGTMWANEQHHAKVIIPERDRNKPIKTLDENTVDYIECHYLDIITEAMLEGMLSDDKEYTCRAGIIDDDFSLDPTKQKPGTEDAPF